MSFVSDPHNSEQPSRPPHSPSPPSPSPSSQGQVVLPALAAVLPPRVAAAAALLALSTAGLPPKVLFPPVATVPGSKTNAATNSPAREVEDEADEEADETLHSITAIVAALARSVLPELLPYTTNTCHFQKYDCDCDAHHCDEDAVHDQDDDDEDYHHNEGPGRKEQQRRRQQLLWSHEITVQPAQRQTVKALLLRQHQHQHQARYRLHSLLFNEEGSPSSASASAASDLNDDVGQHDDADSNCRGSRSSEGEEDDEDERDSFCGRHRRGSHCGDVDDDVDDYDGDVNVWIRNDDDDEDDYNSTEEEACSSNGRHGCDGRHAVGTDHNDCLFINDGSDAEGVGVGDAAGEEGEGGPDAAAGIMVAGDDGAQARRVIKTARNNINDASTSAASAARARQQVYRRWCRAVVQPLRQRALAAILKATQPQPTQQQSSSGGVSSSSYSLQGLSPTGLLLADYWRGCRRHTANTAAGFPASTSHPTAAVTASSAQHQPAAPPAPAPAPTNAFYHRSVYHHRHVLDAAAALLHPLPTDLFDRLRGLVQRSCLHQRKKEGDRAVAAAEMGEEDAEEGEDRADLFLALPTTTLAVAATTRLPTSGPEAGRGGTPPLLRPLQLPTAPMSSDTTTTTTRKTINTDTENNNTAKSKTTTAVPVVVMTMTVSNSPEVILPLLQAVAEVLTERRVAPNRRRKRCAAAVEDEEREVGKAEGDREEEGADMSLSPPPLQPLQRLFSTLFSLLTLLAFNKPNGSESENDDRKQPVHSDGDVEENEAVTEAESVLVGLTVHAVLMMGVHWMGGAVAEADAPLTPPSPLALLPPTASTASVTRLSAALLARIIGIKRRPPPHHEAASTVAAAAHRTVLRCLLRATSVPLLSSSLVCSLRLPQAGPVLTTHATQHSKQAAQQLAAPQTQTQPPPKQQNHLRQLLLQGDRQGEEGGEGQGPYTPPVPPPRVEGGDAGAWSGACEGHARLLLRLLLRDVLYAHFVATSSPSSSSTYCSSPTPLSPFAVGVLGTVTGAVVVGSVLPHLCAGPIIGIFTSADLDAVLRLVDQCLLQPLGCLVPPLLASAASAVAATTPATTSGSAVASAASPAMTVASVPCFPHTVAHACFAADPAGWWLTALLARPHARAAARALGWSARCCSWPSTEAEGPIGSGNGGAHCQPPLPATTGAAGGRDEAPRPLPPSSRLCHCATLAWGAVIHASLD